jgi:hypothetical protein
MTITQSIESLLSFRAEGPNAFSSVALLRDVRPRSEESLFDFHFRHSVLT